MSGRCLNRVMVASASLLAIAGACLAQTQTRPRAPADLLQRVGFDQHLGAQVPLDAVFRDADGRPVRLRGLLDGKPALLVPGYYTCRNLCTTVRAGVANAVRRSGLVPGEQFNVLLVSIDPHDGPASARTTQSNDELSHPDARVADWHYLSGAETAMAPLMRSIGFRYFLDDRNDQYAHAAGIVLLTPQGRVAQYLFGVRFAPETLRLALVHASQGGIGTIVDRLLLLCCDYDASTGRYTVTIERVMQALGIATALTLIGGIGWLRRIERRHQGSNPP
ncbi:MAG TPA: SCO family protein [Rhodanobacteraceae bacterium]|nr:SCO family protein [Rhodanobacteraceae bacterium]